MVHIYADRNGAETKISIHQGEGDPTDTMIMEMDVATAVANTMLADLLDGAVTIHGVGA